MYGYPAAPIHKGAVIFNMARGDTQYQKLLEIMSGKELDILRRHPDLISRLQFISKLTESQALAELKDEYSLEIDAYMNGEMWISGERLEDAIPDWFHSDHCGWYLSQKEGELINWAKKLLTQEVRINVWIRYLEHKKDPKPEIFYGQYL